MARELTRRAGFAPGRGRRIALIAVAVLLVHAWLAQRVASGLIDLDADRSMPARIEVAYVREMALSAPPPTAAPAAPPAPVERRVRAPRPAKAASAPPRAEAKRRGERRKRVEPVEAAASAAAADPVLAAASAAEDAETSASSASASASAPVADAPASAPIEVAADAASSVPAEAASSAVLAAAVAPSLPDAAASSPAPVAVATLPASGPAAAAFEWPSSTRMSYVLTGNYRGPVNGSAQVEWIRAGRRYQVHLDLLVGPSFAPIITRQMTSDGVISAAGLAPQRYDQDTKVVLRDRQRVTITFDPDVITLANGDRRPNTPGMQDTASQFVQLTYVFSTRPELLRIGGSVEIPLALPHKVDVWTYDVVAQETLYTGFGPLPAIHLKPRRSGPPKIGELSAEIWFAPQLRYLPVRIRIQQNEQNYLDLLIDKPPEMAAG
ncbi:MAG TPA: DUF3108 domain-containing protein [Burkholderiaceae bacterium]|jgi:hypothetical protein